MTKMIPRPNNFSSRHRSRGPWLVAAVVVFFLIMIWGGPILDKLFGGSAMVVARPFWTIREYLMSGLSPLTNIFATKGGLLRENEKLNQELSDLRLMKIDYGVITKENEELRELAGLGSSNAGVTVGKVVSNSWNSPYDILLAALPSGAGQESDQSGNLVTYHNNLALGRVEKVVASVAKIILFSIGSSKVAAVIGSERVPVLLSGRGNGNFVTELPRNLDIVLGSTVLLVEGKRDYTLGVVGAVSKTPGETLQTVYVRSPINISQLKYVEINSR